MIDTKEITGIKEIKVEIVNRVMTKEGIKLRDTIDRIINQRILFKETIESPEMKEVPKISQETELEKAQEKEVIVDIAIKEIKVDNPDINRVHRAEVTLSLIDKVTINWRRYFMIIKLMITIQLE